MRVQEDVREREWVGRGGLQLIPEPLIENDPVFVDWNGQEVAHGCLGRFPVTGAHKHL
jgi:hypothetical protein